MTTLGGWLLGVLLGIRHAFEPDHLAAVATLVRGERTFRRAARLGALWGAGHTLALLAVGLVLAILQARLPARVETAFEMGVAVMLIVLGIGALRGPKATPPLRIRRPLAIGVVHGLAGSGVLTAFVIANLPGAAARLIYIALFGLGSLFGMALVSGLFGWPLARIGARAERVLGLITGALSTILGLFWLAQAVF